MSDWSFQGDQFGNYWIKLDDKVIEIISKDHKLHGFFAGFHEWLHEIEGKLEKKNDN